MYYTVIIFIFLAFAGDTAGALHGKRFGEMMPVTVLSIGLILYVFGLIEQLYLGFLIVCIAAGLMYVWCFVSVIIKKKWKDFCSCFFTRTFFLFVVVCVVMLWGDYKQQGTTADDLGHWMDCVKSMVWSGKFYTANTFSVSSHSTYPPFISLLQYAVQIGQMKLFGGQFSEWLLFYVYHSLIVILCLPVLSCVEQKTKRWFSSVVSMLVVIIVPTILFQYIFNRTMIDPLLAVAAAVMFILIVSKEEIKTSKLYLGLLLPSLVLMKDLGLFFSVFGLLFLLIVSIKEKKIKTCLVPALGIIAAKVSWEIIIKRYNAVDPKSNHVNWFRYTKVLLGLAEYNEEYKNTSVQLYRNSLFDKKIQIGESLISTSMPYILFIVILLVLFFLEAYIIKKHRQDNSACQTDHSILNGIILSVMIVIFWFGLGGVYADKFIYSEAVNLASFERYFNTVIAVILFEMVSLLLLNHHKWRKPKAIVILPIILILLSPNDGATSYLKREYYQNENKSREEANRFAEIITETCEINSYIYLVSQSGNGWWDYTVAKFMIRPGLALQSTANNDYNWRFIKEGNADDIYSKEMHREEWETIIFDSNKYQYVAIAKVDNYFIEEFEPMFETTSINNRSIYKIDRDNRKLELLFIEE